MARGEAPPPVAVSMGEPAGIGTEIMFKVFAALSGSAVDVPAFFVIDDPARVARLAREAATSFRVVTISEPGEAIEAMPSGLPVLPLGNIDLAPLAHVTPGQPTTATAEAVIASIRQAVGFALKGAARGVVTLPIQKSVLTGAGFHFPGHTEFLGALTEEAAMPEGLPRGPAMMLSAGSFRTVPATVHQSLRSVPDSLSADQLVRLGVMTARSLAADFAVPSPRVAFAGLNPHAGEAGTFGSEDRDVILPAVEALREQGIDASGPWPADTMFHEEARGAYDAAIAMYHDQALIPIKTVAFHQAVNVTLGLPIVRTSPDHGTGLAIAGKGIARPDSTLAALLLAVRIGENRARLHG